MQGIEALSTIERLKILKSISIGCASDDDFEHYLTEFSGELEVSEAKRRVEGLLLEDEFLLLCKIMNRCNSINGLEQGLSIDNGYKVPDYLASFNMSDSLYDPDKKLNTLLAFVEVKTSKKSETKKISPSFLKKYSAYARSFDFPLLIASRLKLNEKQQWWIIQTKQQFENNGRKASVESLSNCVSQIIFNDYFITATQDIIVEIRFTEKPDKSKSYDPEHGYLHSVLVRSEFGIIKLENEHLSLNLFLDCFAQEFISKNETSEFITVTRVINFMQGQLLSDMLLRANFCKLDKSGSKYSSASRLLALVENGEASIIKRENFEATLSFFNANNLLFMITKIGDIASNIETVNLLMNEG